MSIEQQLRDAQREIKNLPHKRQSEYLVWLSRLRKRHKQSHPIDRSLKKLSEKLSVESKSWSIRASNLPTSKLNQSLPIYQQREKIIELIQTQQVVVIAGETGSGKTTQLPQLCLDAGLGKTGMIGHTQPRRIAATAVASRIADELNCKLGVEVGYQIRFEKQVSENTYIKLMTDGVLLNELHDDPYLLKYDALIIDEAHERSINIDFILGVVKGILKKRTDFKVVITSATIDIDKFSKHFDNAPIVEVSGRTYPVEMRYRAASDYPDVESFEQHALAAVRELSREGPGDILVFLPSEQVIRHLADYFRRHLQKKYQILPLYSRLAKQQQMTIFKPHTGSRIVLATNIAETSLTVPGIKYVIDSGLARTSRYSTRSKVQRLPIETISQASCNQRAGRCGRVSSGICIRLFSEQDFNQRPEFVEPEILRTNLAMVILQMAQLELGAVETFDFIDPPLQKQINDGIQLLMELQAMTEGRHITALGEKLARLPVDPRIGRILIAAADNNALREVTTIAALIGVQDPRERPVEQQQKADELHLRFQDRKSDFIGIMKLWQYFHDLVDDLSWNQVRKRCMAEFIHYQRMREWREHVSQLLHIMRGLGYKVNESDADYDAIHQSLLSGFLTQIGNYDPRGYYLAPRQVKIHIFPGSGLFKKSPKKSQQTKENKDSKSKGHIAWIMAAEWVETSKNYARMVAEIKPEWVESYALKLLKKQQSEPYWSSKGGRAMIKESGLLFGLPIYNNRRKPLDLFNPELARDLFITNGLIEKGFNTTSRVLRSNWKTYTHAEEIQLTSRRHDLIVPRDWFINFYNKRLPSTINNGRAFDKWSKQLTAKQSEDFLFNIDDICSVDIESNRALFPDKLQIRTVELAVEYRFEPGQEHDGLDIQIPLLFLNQINKSDFQWLIPGLFEELIIALIRSLPKSKRKRFVPVPDYARALIERLDPGLPLTLYQQMASGLQKMSGELMSEQDFNPHELPANLIPTFTVHDDESVIAKSNDLNELQELLKNKVQSSVAVEEQTIVYTSFPDTDFEFATKMKQGIGELTIYQGLKSTKNGVQLDKSDDESMIRRNHRQALTKLIINDSNKLVREMETHLGELKTLRLSYSSLKNIDPDELIYPTDTLMKDLIVYSVSKTLKSEQIFCNSPDSFTALSKLVNTATIPDAIELSSPLLEIFKIHRDIRKKLEQLNPLKYLDLISAIKQRLDELVFQGFIHCAGDSLIRHYPRYMKGLLLRLETATNKPLLERERSIIWDKYWQQYSELAANDKSSELRQSIEEFHVMIFAQQLGTKKKVSEKRLKLLFAEIN